MRTRNSIHSESVKRSFLRNERGVAAIEFAMIVPMLLTLYLGGVDLCLGITLNRKVQHASSLMNDLATRANNLQAADLDGIIDVGNAAVMPRAPSLSTTIISGIHIDGDGKATITWSRARNIAAETVGQTVSLPPNVKDLRNENLVKTLATYNYVPFGTLGFIDPFVMKEEIFATARTGPGVTCSNC